MEQPNTPSFWTLWWNAIDRWSLFSVMILMGLGVWLIMTVSPSIALHHKWSPLVLLKRHLLMVGPGVCLLLLTSLSSRSSLILTSRIVALLAWIGVWAVLFLGAEIKGAKRWLSIMGFSLQPSEFLKPAFTVIMADFLSRRTHYLEATLLLMVVIFPLFLQPDLGMVFLMALVCFGQCFISGLPWVWTISGGIGSLVACLGVYLCFPHAACRIQTFLSGGSQDPFGGQYQILQALKSFSSGGLLGKGPGAGTILHNLPDGHADFIFAVAGEELGVLVCLFMVSLYGMIILRGLWYASQEMDGFYTLALSGLILQLAFQTFLNMASVLQLIPTKGVTLPFVSYGGSSFLSLCWAMGMILALSRRYRGLI